jgi:succinyl-diaminopimelate desuccinylase
LKRPASAASPCAFGEVSNLWRGAARQAAALLCRHTDVVPTGRSRMASDPFVPTIRDGKLYGRGAADMKSSIAAFVVAARAFVKERPKHSARSPSSSPRTRKARGGRHREGGGVLKKRGETMDYCIVGEPTR